MSSPLDAAGLAIATTELCRNLATGLYFLIREIRDASKDAGEFHKAITGALREG